jgi:choline transporter-like protein 2/4/5
MVVVAGLGFSQGNPDVVLYPYDEDGRQCGKGLADYPYLYFYKAVSNTTYTSTAGLTQGVCVKTCPSERTSKLDCKPTTLNTDCSISNENFYHSTSWLERMCIPDPNYKSTDSTAEKVNITYANGTTKEVYIQDQASSAISISLNTDKLVAWMSDLVTTWPILLASIGIAIVVALIYLMLLRCCAGVIAYTTIFLILGALAGLGYVFQARIEYYQKLNDENYVLAMKVMSGLFYALAGLWLLIILFMCNRIRLSIALTKVTARYVGSNCSLFLIPPFFFLLSMTFYAYWVVLSIWLYSSGKITKSANFYPEIEWNSTTRYAWWYHLFGLFYISAFISALNQFVLASSACIWYFEQANPDGANKPIRRSFYRAFRYHLGSLAFGSLIIAIIKFMMVMMEYVKKQVESAGAPKSSVYKCLISCCQCCLACVARVMEFINRHAYIMVYLFFLLILDCFKRRQFLRGRFRRIWCHYKKLRKMEHAILNWRRL